jgi:DNA methylase
MWDEFRRKRKLIKSGNITLELHPTVKPIALVSDALLDSTKRDDMVLDPYLGSGTTILAAERTGRRCYGIEALFPMLNFKLRNYHRSMRYATGPARAGVGWLSYLPKPSSYHDAAVRTCLARVIQVSANSGLCCLVRRWHIRLS